MMNFDLGTTIGAILTIFVFSFLYKDNPLYRFAEHLVVGITVGYGFVLSVQRVFIPYVWNALVLQHRWYLIFPAFVGLLWWTRFSKNLSWLSRYPIAFSMGVGSGIALPLTMQTNILVQLRSTMMDLIVSNPDASGIDVVASINAILVFVGVISVLLYFYFSKEHTGVYGHFAKLGVWFLMISFGASFGYTVMARISLLIGRFQYLFGDWLGLIK
jgi:hypothetical protein